MEVEFKVIATGAVVKRKFDSFWECKKFINKLRHSKKCQLISYPKISEY